MLDFTGRAKWDAWKATKEKYGDRATEVEERYLEIATELGWDGERSQPAGGQEPLDNTVEGEDSIWDTDDAPQQGGGISGLGISVSTVSYDDDEDTREEGTFHNYAVSGNTEELEAYLVSHPDTQVNEIDEYVRATLLNNGYLVNFSQGYTALHLASDRGYATVVKFLLEKGADPNVKVLVFSH